ncbi:MAG: phosphoribosyl-AMP cyclohydrolase [Ferrovum sp.]|jgi:phosphoribosyl-AMP cyclohydrolase|nr:phosphoribosyl-AMP cyclohydrolase [Ferrovum sp.]
MSYLFKDINWNEQGLVPVVVQHYETMQVLMLAWMNREALLETIESNRATYWSRSRKKLWRKGEQSGHFQDIKDIRLDCDQDTLLLLVDQVGFACHTGRKHCFFYRWDSELGWKITDPVLRDPKEIYRDAE